MQFIDVLFYSIPICNLAVDFLAEGIDLCWHNQYLYSNPGWLVLSLAYRNNHI